jgi:hypothetical protein
MCAIHRFLFVLALLSWSSAPARAQSQNYSMSPPRGATTEDEVTFTISGIWRDGCVPDRIAHRRVEQTIYVEVEFPGIDVFCTQALELFSLTETLGRLPAGTYDVIGSIYAYDPFPPTKPRQLEQDPREWISDYAVRGRMIGDVNRDGNVDRGDVSMLAWHFAERLDAGGDMLADLDQDRAVGLRDLAMLGSHLGDGTSVSTAVPEPGTLGVLCAAIVAYGGLWLRRRVGPRQ